MKIIAFTRYAALGASSRLRMAQYVDSLAGQGLFVRLVPLLNDDYLQDLYAGRPTNRLRLLKSYLARLIEIVRATKYDLIWIEKELFPGLPAFAEGWLARRGLRYVVDYDDATFHYYDLGRGLLKLRLARKIDKVMRYAALVICGNAYIAERARQAGAKDVRLIPTVVDLTRYPQKTGGQTGPIVIGWIGSPSTVKYLDMVTDAIASVAREFSVQLRVVGATYYNVAIPVECRPWSESTEAAEIGQFDIGIMPLFDSPWERGKCGYKLIQYMACGVPVVGSPVGVNTEIIEEGRNGYLASSVAEWEHAFRKLCADIELRQTMGQAGRQIVEERYCMQVTAPLLASYLKDTVNGRN